MGTEGPELAVLLESLILRSLSNLSKEHLLATLNHVARYSMIVHP
jgi:hypothetical protein